MLFYFLFFYEYSLTISFPDLCKKKLAAKGFSELKEVDNWELKKGGKYFFTRNNTTLVAFTIGGKFDANNTGFKLLGTHTDSPNLRLAPLSKLKSLDYNQTCIQLYGGGLWHTWFDRDLMIGGRVIYKNEKQQYDTTLFKSERALFRIPNLAIHLTPADKRSAFEFNKETNFRPIISTSIYDQLSYPDGLEKDQSNGDIAKKHYRGLLDLVSKTTGIKTENILDLDFSFADSQPSAVVGLYEEFISSARLDNLFSSYHSLDAIVNAREDVLNESSFINLALLFDHEEIGSTSQQGADSNIVLQNLHRIYKILSAEQKDVKIDSLEKAIQRSFILSADMAHAINPNYPEKHQSCHQPKLNQGIVLKTDKNQRYTTDGVSGSIIRAIADKAGVPIQEFIVRNDSPCGSTIGPMLSNNTGIKAADIGAPQFAMHSCREMCGVLDGYYYNKLFLAFFEEFEKLDSKLLDG